MGLIDSEKIALLNLLAVPGIGSWGAIRLVQDFGQPSKVFSAGDGSLRSVPRIGEKAIEAIRKADVHGDLGKKQLEAADKCGARVISYWDEKYPRLLKELEQDAPAVLFVRGTMPAEARRVAFVGTRRASDYGRRACKEIINGLAGSGIYIVSGLASGIDGAAHLAALERALPTEAVFGCGIDIIYPDGHKTLAQKILDAGGALVSEYPPGTQPSGFTFPQRNRIIAGMSLATVVIEAPEKSGALITARLAGSYGREVGAVPGFVVGGKAAGCHELIKEGAALIDSAQDILDLIKVSTRAAQISATAPAPNLAEPERQLWDLIPGDDKIHIDILSDKAGQGTGEVLSRLLMMELKGYIRQLPGKFFVRA
ncbi:MAG: DNA-processing protein DprA [Calditrichaeota bacterium]|nr:DNA-processing protein DprA [Calditrichota bacterium]MCB9367941.1 DNA-protecting protein DprA [Calditrichota bacterium]